MDFQLKSLRSLVGKAITRVESLAARLQKNAFHAVVGPGLRPGAEHQLLRLKDEVGFAGKRVLEIGGDLEGTVARACLALGAKHVTSINHDRRFQSRQNERSSFRRMDGAALDFPAAHFDLVIGLAVLEHIRPFKQVLESVWRVTRPNGLVYLQGGPLWFSRKGHHLVLIGATGQRWRFNGRDGGINPIEDWDHLRLEPAELLGKLVLRGCSPVDAQAIVDYVYGTELINRYSANELGKFFGESRLTIRRCIPSQEPARQEVVLADLASQYRLPEREFRISSIAFLASR